MNYQQTVEYLYNSTPVFEKIGVGAYKEGLSTTLALDEYLGHPHRHFATIHVAGTNGKGSVSHTLASILQKAGKRVGLFTSPHLVDFRERIRVNGECVSEEFVVNFVDKHRHFFEPLHPSFFELTTAMAFDYFAHENVDIAVIEVGLGGRLDCTNIITPILSVITNISMDHTQLLGNTLAAIAKEKAGIIKPGIPVVIGEANKETRPVFEEKAESVGAPIFFAEDHPIVECMSEDPNNGNLYLTRKYGHIHGDLGGNYQLKNANTILNAVERLRETPRFFVTTDDIKLGFANVCRSTGLMGRWQRLQEHPTVICDTGHNVGGWLFLSQQLKSLECHRLRIVFGMVDDKDIQTVMAMLPKEAAYYFTKADCKRAIPETTVQETGMLHGLLGNAYPTVAEAFESALADAADDDLIFVGGSSYVVADLLSTHKSWIKCF